MYPFTVPFLPILTPDLLSIPHTLDYSAVCQKFAVSLFYFLRRWASLARLSIVVHPQLHLSGWRRRALLNCCSTCGLYVLIKNIADIFEKTSILLSFLTAIFRMFVVKINMGVEIVCCCWMYHKPLEYFKRIPSPSGQLGGIFGRREIL